MSKITKLAFVALALGVPVRYFITPSPSAEEKQSANLHAMIEKLTPLHQALGKPRPGDWLISHPERGETFALYLQTLPVRATGKRSVIYVRPLGDFTASQDKIVTLTADFMHRYFDLAVKVLPRLPLSVIPESARRQLPGADEQILTTYVLTNVLKPDLPDDAAAIIAFTASDLWPGEDWNFVYGQASSSDRVGVWSINRNGDPDTGEAEFRLCLLRAMKTATHETGHMFSISHCTKYECNMCGSNNRGESDRRPVEVCPECLAKICWATNCDPVERFRELAEFCEQQGFDTEKQFYERSLAALTTGRIERKR